MFVYVFNVSAAECYVPYVRIRLQIAKQPSSCTNARAHSKRTLNWQCVCMHFAGVQLKGMRWLWLPNSTSFTRACRSVAMQKLYSTPQTPHTVRTLELRVCGGNRKHSSAATAAERMRVLMGFMYIFASHSDATMQRRTTNGATAAP